MARNAAQPATPLQEALARLAQAHAGLGHRRRAQGYAEEAGELGQE